MVDRELIGRTLGEFVLLELIGEGGYGAVYRCEQPMLKRKAVVKVLHARHQSAAALERFEQEAQLASRLDHPYAAHIYSFRAEDDGTLWIAMELVRGITLSEWLKQHGPMPLEQFVPFFERVADVVDEAHKRGIVHRDLKPSNIMVMMRRGRLYPTLLDFGIAHVDYQVAFAEPTDAAHRTSNAEGRQSASPNASIDAPTPDHATTDSADSGSSVKAYRLTHTGARFGSAPYMSPEQWYDSSSVGPASDIYSLGVVAFEALTGKAPFTADNIDSYFECHRDADVPSIGDQGSPELDRIIRRALAKSPRNRHRDVLELADDFKAVLRASAREQLRSDAQQWADRGRDPRLLWNRAGIAGLNSWSSRRSSAAMSELECSFVASSERRARRAAWSRRAATLVAVLVALGAFAYRSSLRLRMAEQIAMQSEAEQGRQALLHGESKDAVLHLEQAYRRGDRSSGMRFMLARALQPRMSELGRLPSSSGRMWSAAFSPDGKRIVTSDDDSVQLWDAGSHQLLFTMRHGDTVYQATFSSDGTRIFSAGADGAVRIWNAGTGALLRALTWPGAQQPRYYALVASTRFVVAIDTMGRTAHAWDSETGKALAELTNDASEAASIALSADGRWLATSGGDEVRVFDTVTWKQVAAIRGPRVRSLAFDPSGWRLAVGTYDGDATVWDIPGGIRTRHLRQGGESVDAIAFSRNGKFIAAAGRDGVVQVWDAQSGALSIQVTAHHSPVHRVEFSPAGDLLLSAGADGAVGILNVVTGKPVGRLEGPKGAVFAAHFDVTGRRVVGASWDGTARVWDSASPYQTWGAPDIGPECDTMDALQPDGRYIALACREHGTRVWDTARAELLAELPSVTSVAGDYYSAFPALTMSGDRAAIARGATVDVYALPSGQLIRTVAHRAPVNAVTFAPTGHDLVTGSIDGEMFVTRDDREPVALPTSPGGIDALAVLANGRIVVADATARVRVIDPDRNAVLMDLPAPSRVRLLRPSPNGERLITISIRSKQAPPVLWDLDEGKLVAQLEGHVGRVFSARFVAAGSKVLTAGRDGTARVWDAGTGAEVQTLHGDAHFLVDAAMSSDGATVVAGGSDGFLRFWDATSGHLLWELQAHKSYVVGVHYEGTDIITRGFAGDVSRWTLPQPDLVIDTCHARGCASPLPLDE